MTTSDVQGDLWGQRVEDWAALQEEHHKPLWNAMLASLEVGPGVRFVDLGCGAGGASELAADLGASVAGLDAAEAMIAHARKRLPNGDFRVGDLEALPFADG